MLRIRKNASAKAAQNYFREGLTKDDYYSKDAESKEVPGWWGGKTAEMLGLSGGVSKADFYALCNNRKPDGSKLTPRDKANRRVGFDFTFSAPKSLSVLHALGIDSRVQLAFQEAVQFTMERIEADARTRVRANGQTGDRLTGNMVWAAFLHETTRPVKDALSDKPDPHLHVHAFTFNVSYDHEEQCYKALEPGAIWADAYYYQAVFHARLAERMRGLGYAVERKGKAFEVSGLPKAVAEKYARSQARNEKKAKELEARTDRYKDQIKDRLRRRKNEALGWNELREDWRGRLSEEERRELEGLRERGLNADRNFDPAQSIEHARLEAFERASVVPERRLLAEALYHGAGRFSVDQIHRIAREHAGFIRRTQGGQLWLTTPQVVAEERKIVAFAQAGLGRFDRLGREGHVVRDGDRLSREQRLAVHELLASKDQVVMLEGRAGVGKTTLLREVVAGVRAKGQEVHAFAPSAEASRGTLRKEGFEGADTVANLLQQASWRERLKGQVILIDEAAMVSAPQMRQVFELAEQAEARILLAGDPRQHRSVERGRAWELLKERAGVKTVEVSGVKRQSGKYRQAVERASAGDLKGGFETLDELGWVKEIKSQQARHAELVKDYVEARERGQSVLVVSPTHREGAEVTRDLRAALRENGTLKGPDRSFAVLRDTQWTEAQRADASNYEAGQQVVFHRATAGGFKTREVWTVDRVTEGDSKEVWLRSEANETRRLPLDKARQFGVYERQEIQLAVGDSIRVTANGQTLEGGWKLHNGTLDRVSGFTKEGHVKLEGGGGVLSKDYGHFQPGYVITSHSSQGQTVDRVLIAQSSASFSASDRSQMYVSLSRGRYQATVYTDSREELLAAVSRERIQRSGVDLLDGDRPRKSMVVSGERNLFDPEPAPRSEAGEERGDRLPPALEKWHGGHTDRKDELLRLMENEKNAASADLPERGNEDKERSASEPESTLDRLARKSANEPAGKEIEGAAGESLLDRLARESSLNDRRRNFYDALEAEGSLRDRLARESSLSEARDERVGEGRRNFFDATEAEQSAVDRLARESSLSEARDGRVGEGRQNFFDAMEAKEPATDRAEKDRDAWERRAREDLERDV